ncbi:MAG: hypothetical protein QM530_06390 [Phycisphaerales bacterium]|nr:hypothetical protein [Phycisphaerales bacterium]
MPKVTVKLSILLWSGGGWALGAVVTRQNGIRMEYNSKIKAILLK